MIRAFCQSELERSKSPRFLLLPSRGIDQSWAQFGYTLEYNMALLTALHLHISHPAPSQSLFLGIVFPSIPPVNFTPFPLRQVSDVYPSGPMFSLAPSGFPNAISRRFLSPLSLSFSRFSVRFACICFAYLTSVIHSVLHLQFSTILLPRSLLIQVPVSQVQTLVLVLRKTLCP